MRQWYYSAGGQVFGPFSEDELRAWVGQGRLAANDFVWTEGMANWATVGQVFAAGPGFAAAPGPQWGSVSMVLCPAPAGAGGQTPNRMLAAQARACLQGRWGQAVAFSLLLTLLLVVAGAVSWCVPVNLLVAGPFMLGSCIFFLTLTRGGKTDVNMLFEGFRNFGNSLATYIVQNIFIALWTLLLIVPGIIAGLAYSQTFYLLANDRTLGPLEAIRKSKQMMAGHKWRLFCLHLRFFGWGLLCVLTLGIGCLWLMPYMAAAQARFYDDLRQSPAAAPMT